MDFKELFLNALHTNPNLTKTISIENYIPNSIQAWPILDGLPCILAYGDINASYPYYYELSNLDCYCIILTYSGSGLFMSNGTNSLLTLNTMAFINCNQQHRIEIKQSPWRYQVFFIKGNPISDLYNSFVKDYRNLHSINLGSSIPDITRRLFLQLEKNPYKTFLHSKFLLDILYELLIEKNSLEPNQNIIPEYLKKIKYTFDMNYHKSFTLDNLEQEYHISKYRICHEFTEYFDLPPIQYLNHKRIDIAKEALIFTDKRINEIGRIVGFENTNHFIRLFKQQTGVTPLAFRKKSPVFTN